MRGYYPPTGRAQGWDTSDYIDNLSLGVGLGDGFGWGLSTDNFHMKYIYFQ